MPIESMAKRGDMVIAFGPCKPVGLKDPRTDKEPFAVVQLRQDNDNATLYNIVGFQTRLRFPEQRRVFGMIPGLENAEFARYGVMHRNTFLNSPGFLDDTYPGHRASRVCPSPDRSPAWRAMWRARPADCWRGFPPPIAKRDR